MRIVFWQNMISPHQAPLIRQLSETDGLEVWWVVSEEIPQHREELGWAVPESGRGEVVVDPGTAQIRDIALSNPQNSVHILAGLSAYQCCREAIEVLSTQDSATIGIQAEAPNFLGLQGAVRTVREKWYRRKFGRNVDFILALGDLSEVWYRKVRYDDEKIFPFGYFVDVPASANGVEAKADGVDVRDLTFVGQLIPRKGIDTLLFACSRCPTRDFVVRMIGDGPYRRYYEKLAKIIGIDDRVEFHGALPRQRALRAIASSDGLVLPSRWDGWGAVTNEALMQGVPVLLTERCGSRSVINEGKSGYVVEPESPSDLASKMTQLVRGDLSWSKRTIGKKYAELSAENAAEYVCRVVDTVRHSSPRPEPTWPYYRKF